MYAVAVEPMNMSLFGYSQRVYSDLGIVDLMTPLARLG